MVQPGVLALGRVFNFRPPHNFVKNRAVSAVHAVEVADADERRTEVVGNFVEFVKSLHRQSLHRRDAEYAEFFLIKRSSRRSQRLGGELNFKL